MRASAGPLPLQSAVGWELARLEGQLEQVADVQARRQLPEISEAAALRVLQMIRESKTQVRNFSAYIRCAVRNAPDAPTAESAVYSSGPSRGEDSVWGPMYQDDVQMDDDIPNGETAFDFSNHAMIEVESPARPMPSGVHRQ